MKTHFAKALLYIFTVIFFMLIPYLFGAFITRNEDLEETGGWIILGFVLFYGSQFVLIVGFLSSFLVAKFMNKKHKELPIAGYALFYLLAVFLVCIWELYYLKN